MNSGTYKKRKQQMKDTLTSEWDLLAEEVRVYRPEAFDRLRKSFFGFFKNRSMQFIFGREISKGNSPARDWLSANGYPNREEVEHLLFLRSLTEFSRRQFSILHSRFRLKHRNSAAFRSLCERQKKAGFNFFQIWMDSHGFNPVFREQQAAGEAL